MTLASHAEPHGRPTLAWAARAALIAAPSLLLWLGPAPSAASFTAAWIAVVTLVAPGEIPYEARAALVLFAAAHLLFVQYSHWPHTRNVALAALAAAVSRVAQSRGSRVGSPS